ncbi:hypothetical protein VP01_3637g1 [Puccinia sorghi]|uniref:Uncharacterized protein n=1 Tax=Puccinia sorghi TaxID=27349 RepID=A0A0L6UVF8_9BASI|nr:hypothetical protein VP01_3637g1 [Puccinia sorghi]
MRFFALITLLALFLIQSQTAHADFMCDDGRYPNAKVGFCAIRNPQGPQYLVKAANVVNQVSRTFTCSQTTILGEAPSWRWCCSKSPAPFSSSSDVNPVYQYTTRDVLLYCYSRDGPPGTVKISL